MPVTLCIVAADPAPGYTVEVAKDGVKLRFTPAEAVELVADMQARLDVAHRMETSRLDALKGEAASPSSAVGEGTQL
jgi:hypothetical protein